mgnify:CR=1 FL=1
MASFSNPTLFSAYFGMDPSELEKAGLIDTFIDVDTELFIDPVLLEKSGHKIIQDDAVDAFRTHFENFVRLLSISENEGDAAWKGAKKLLDLREPPETGLGYGGSGRSGSSRPEDIRLAMMRTSLEIISLGSKDPEMVSLMGFFEEGVGPDTISDFTTRVIITQLAAITEEFCLSQGIQVSSSRLAEPYKLPRAKTVSGKEAQLLLVPRDIVRELPVANDWSDIESAAFENDQIRSRVNAMLAGIARPTIADRKAALRTLALSSAAEFELFLAVVKEHARNYDPNIDALGYYRLSSILANGFSDWTEERTHELNSPEDVRDLVKTTLEQFAHHVENGNLWEELWIGDKPKKERAAQLIYYAIADCYCKAHNIDISPEANMGGGPVDFKFSKGFDTRVLVEIKRSSGTVVHGYSRQLELYKDAARTQFGIFVIIDFGDLSGKLETIEAMRRDKILAGEPASEIIVIDATKKPSASKRK